MALQGDHIRAKEAQPGRGSGSRTCPLSVSNSSGRSAGSAECPDEKKDPAWQGSRLFSVLPKTVLLTCPRRSVHCAVAICCVHSLITHRLPVVLGKEGQGSRPARHCRPETLGGGGGAPMLRQQGTQHVQGVRPGTQIWAFAAMPSDSAYGTEALTQSKGWPGCQATL